MSNLQFKYLEEGDRKNISVFIDGELLVASEQHPNFAGILDAARADDPGIADLFDVGRGITKRFQKLSADVTIEGDDILYRGVVAEPALSKQILRFLDEGSDFAPLVKFLEKVAANPQDHSREQAWRWLNRHDFTLTDEGDVVGYKGVSFDYASKHAGPGIVDGAEVDHVVSKPGSVVEMARPEVAHNPRQGCAYGLHVGTFAYADDFKGSGGVVVEVHVSPADIVSVPSDSSEQKMRVCRYRVVGDIVQQKKSALVPSVARHRKETRPTRFNFKNQERYPRGHAKAGQFKPRGK